jgi:hypothetical protein
LSAAEPQQIIERIEMEWTHPAAGRGHAACKGQMTVAMPSEVPYTDGINVLEWKCHRCATHVPCFCWEHGNMINNTMDCVMNTGIRRPD